MWCDVSRCHTSKKEYHECTDTIAQMKNKTNETKNVHTVYSVICGHDKSAPYSGCTWCKRWCTWVNITCSWNKHWLYINNSSVHSVGVGDRFIAPVHTNCINAITHHSGRTRINVGVHGQSAACIP